VSAEQQDGAARLGQPALVAGGAAWWELINESPRRTCRGQARRSIAASDCTRRNTIGPLAWTGWPIHQQLTEGAKSRSTWRKVAAWRGQERRGSESREQPGGGMQQVARGDGRGAMALEGRPPVWFTKGQLVAQGWRPSLSVLKAMRGKTRQVPGQQARGFLGIQADWFSTRASWSGAAADL